MDKILKIASWNVNSLRARLEHVLDWLRLKTPHVLALQETKVDNQQFPSAPFKAEGYHVFFNGQKAYNGVAFISRSPLFKPLSALPGFEDPQCRILTASMDSIRIVNIYVPNGRSLDSEQYNYKLRWLAYLRDYLQAELSVTPNLVILGDFNIAPEDKDVYDPELWKNKVLVSDPERSAFKKIIQLGVIDSFRLFNKEPGHFTWWDYRSGAFHRNNGLRIDHILSSSALATRCLSCTIDKTTRRWKRPSDHAPILVTYEVTH